MLLFFVITPRTPGATSANSLWPYRTLSPSDRPNEATKRGVEPATVGEADWLVSRREELVDRMHTRRERDVGVGYGSSSGYGGRRSYTRAWRPGLFTFK